MTTAFKLLLPAFVVLLSSAAGPSPLVSSGMKATSKQERQTISKAVMQSEVERAAGLHKATAGAKGGSTNDIMIVDPKEVSQDWKQAFNMLKVKQTGGILFHLANGETVSDIMEIDALQGGYLMFFTIKNLHGLQYKIIKTSEIVSLSTK